MNPEEISARIQRIENDLAELKAAVRQQSSSSSTQTAETRPTSSVTTPPRPPAKPGIVTETLARFKEDNVEVFLGGNLLGKLGIVAIVLAVSWFIKLAFDNQWVNESGRIYTGLLVGFAIAGVAVYLAKRNMRVVPAPLFGAGISIVYISLFSAYHFYYLLGIQEVFVSLFVLSVAATVLSLTANRQSLYVFGLIGSFLAPIMLSRGENSYRFLFTYIAVIQLGFLWVSWYRPWRISAVIVLAGTAIMWAGWASNYLNKSGFVFPMAILVFTLAAFFVRHTFLSLRHKTTPSIPDLIILPLSSLFYASAGYYLTRHHYPNAISHFLLVLTLLMAFFYIRYTAIEARDNSTRSILFFQILLFTFASISQFFDGRLLTLSWIVFASALSISSVTLKTRPVLLVSMIAWILAVFRLIFAEYTPSPFHPLVNVRFALYLVAGVGASITYLRHRRDPFETLVRGFAFLSMFLFVFGTLLENRDFIASPHYRNLGYSYVLGLYAAIFLVYGFLRNHKTMRLCGVFLAALVVMKLYFYDIWTMSRLVRIIAGFSLGVALVVLSIVYQKYRDKILQIGKTLMMWLAAPLALFILLSSNNLQAETIRAGSFKKVASLKPDNPSALKDSKTAYGRFTMNDDLVRAGSSSVRIAWKDRALPYVLQRVREDKQRTGAAVPEVIFEEGQRNARVFVLRLPEAPGGTVWTDLEVESTEMYESGVQVEAGEKPGDWNVIGHRNIYNYAGASDRVISIDAGRSKYLRVTLDKNLHMVFPKVHYGPSRDREVSFDIPSEEWKVTQNTDEHATEFLFNNKDQRKIERLTLQFAEPRFHRRVEVYVMQRASHEFVINTTTGFMKRTNDPADQVLDLASPATDAVKVVVFNEDDAALKLTKSTAFAPLEQVIFQLPSADELATEEGNPEIKIYAGNEYVGFPDYDLSRTMDDSVVSASFTPTALGDNAAFAYSAVEPPLSSWIIRIAFYIGLAALAIPGLRVFRDYAQSVKS